MVFELRLLPTYRPLLSSITAFPEYPLPLMIQTWQNHINSFAKNKTANSEYFRTTRATFTQQADFVNNPRSATYSRSFP